MSVEITTGKVCSKCKQEKPFADFPTNGHYASGEIRLHSWCLDCLRQYSSSWQIANKDYFRAWSKAHREDARLGSLAYRLAHPDKIKAIKAMSRERHKDENREYARRYHQNHLDERRKYMAEYYPAYYLAHKDELISYQRTYRVTPIGRAVQRASQLRRRAQKMGAEAANLAQIIRAIRLSPSVTCHICRLSLPGSDCHIDHIMPLSRGGCHVEENIAPSHPLCNRRKGAKIIIKEDLRRKLK